MSGVREDFAASGLDIPTARPLIMGRRGVVAAGHHLATAAGLDLLQSGGNAVDAGVAAGIALNVLLFDRTSFGGVAPIILYHAPTRELVTIDGLGVWPERTTIEELDQDGRPDGILRTVTPGAPDSWFSALGRYGTATLAQVLAPAHRLAAEGAPVSRGVAANLRRRESELDSLDAEARRTFFPRGRAPRVGEIIVQSDLAATFEDLMRVEAEARLEGKDRTAAIRCARDHFYTGSIAEKIADFYAANGGWLRYGDLQNHRAAVESPLHTSYRGYDVYTCGFWCQGPVLLQALNILESFDLNAHEPGSASYLHLLIEAMDLVFADRENFYADPRVEEVPVQGLLSAGYARRRAALVEADRAHGHMPDPGNPYRFQPGAGDREVRPLDVTRYIDPGADNRSDTSYVAAADADGSIFSATPSDPVFWTPMVPGLGFSCSGRGIQSRTEPGHPARIAPGRRPRLTPNPALVFVRGQPLLGFGCPGGDAQTQGMLQVLLSMIHFGTNPQEAIEAPRVTSWNFPNSFAPHTYHPGRVDAEEGISAGVRESLASMGHDVHEVGQWAPSSSSVHVALCNPRDGTLLAGADPRTEGAAAGR